MHEYHQQFTITILSLLKFEYKLLLADLNPIVNE